MTAFVMLLLLFIAAFATDLGAWYRQSEEQQRAADVGSLNGVSTFDRETKAFFESVGVSNWEQLEQLGNPALLTSAENQGFRAAAATVQALLETSGLTFTGPGSFTIATDPTGADGDYLDTDSTSVATLTATDGSVVTITRAFIENPEGSGEFSRVIDVVVQRNGEQYFSNIIRDAPLISRSAQAVVSNCGATCDQLVRINPPFAGFAAGGEGDGFAPLLVDSNGNGETDQVWAVNHHSNGNGRVTGPYNVVCIDIASNPGNPTPCVINGQTSPYGLPFQTATFPEEHVRGTKLYFPAQEGLAEDNPTGIACYDTTIPGPCGGVGSDASFYELWPIDTNIRGFNAINMQGPFVHDDRMYAVSQHGQISCVTFNFTNCTNGAGKFQNLSTFGDPRLPALDDDTWPLAKGHVLGGFLYLAQSTDTGVFFSKIDLRNDSGQVSEPVPPRFANNLPNLGLRGQTFIRHDTNRNPIGICTANTDANRRAHACVSLNAWNLEANPISGLNDLFGDLGPNHWNGDAFTWEGRRTFFSGGASNRIACWNWQTSSACSDGLGGVVTTDTAYHGVSGGRVDGADGVAWTYAFAQISDSCIIALGDNAIFFSFNPEGFTPCVEADLTTPIVPCTCSDGGDRYGVIQLPAELINQVDAASATVTLGEGGPVVLTVSDVLATAGQIDLSGVDQNPAQPYFLVLRVSAKIDPSTGLPFWQTPIDVPLEIDVRPTLTQ